MCVRACARAGVRVCCDCGGGCVLLLCVAHVVVVVADASAVGVAAEADGAVCC